MLFLEIRLIIKEIVDLVLRIIMIRFVINVNFRRRIPAYVTVVSLKESRGIRISLNVVRST